MTKTIEQQVADVVLEREIATVSIAGVTYKVAPPSIATLILISEIVSTLPEVPRIDVGDPDRNQKIFDEVIRNARHYKAIGEVAAVLILGAKGLTKEVSVEVTKKRFFGLIKHKERITQTIDRKAALAKLILENFGPKDLVDLLLSRMNGMEIGSFFVITTSLAGANILKPTKEVGQ